MSFVNSYRYASGGGSDNPCGTGASYPAGWKFLHTEISGGLGSWGNMLKVEGFNDIGATISNVGDGSEDFCYLDGEIDKTAIDSFFSADSDVDNQYDQFGVNDLVDYVAGDGYSKTDNNLNFGGCENTAVSGDLALLNTGDPWTICIVTDYTGIPQSANGHNPFGSTSGLLYNFTGSNTLIIRFLVPNQGWAYSGLRTAGKKLAIITYDGTSPINRSGLNLYWNGSTTAEVPTTTYNSGTPTNAPVTSVQTRGGATNPDFALEFDIFDHAFNSSEITAALEVYEQKYTFS
tara:strand:- start:199 stop:1068 length:870 start_codon:yes stop_codon:yes gene_type:complete